MSKRKRVVLSLKDKINIIDSLNKGETGCKLAEKYGVGASTISDIKKNTDSILLYTCKFKHRKVMKKPKNELLDEALFCWFLQERSTGQPISGPLLCEKALQLNKKIGGDKSFVASNGWLYRFKSRHGIRELEIQGEKMSANVYAANSFKDDFKKHLDENNYDLDFVYNADETGLNWKSLPSKSSVSIRENSAPGYKSSKERVTLLACANATGTHKIPLLLIGKSKNPRCLKNVRVPLIYKNQKSAWMNSEIFIDWYDNTFIPEVKKRQKKIGKEGNVLLVLDNAPTHPSAELLERENKKFKVKFLPPNVTSLLQPMDQVIETLKRLYRKQLLRRLLSVDEDNVEVVVSFFKKMNLKECCYMIIDAWDLIERKTLNNAWNKLLNRDIENSVTHSDDSILEDIKDLILNIQICKDCDNDDVQEWITCDSNDPGFQMMSDDEVIENLLQSNEKHEIKEDETEDNQDEEYNAGPSHDQAVHALETAMKWFEKQTESDPMSLLQLKRIRDIAAMKRKSGLRQMTITKYYKPN
ncbi:unnamed protein product [Danaus chrysippus]|uniref:(African queen) hypothetical protein n=1 Tax=Danaus chrysippus TaxID=151541 RepID=A0A8J2R4I9_9NEOP|nr:unnamed protein product [Danaus chrysippus]